MSLHYRSQPHSPHPTPAGGSLATMLGSLQPTPQLQRGRGDGSLSWTTGISSIHAWETNEVRDQGVDEGRPNEWLRQRFSSLYRTHYRPGWSRVVKDLMAPIEGPHHIVNMDNFFTSPALFTDLLEKGVYARGTVRTNRRHYPRDSLHPKCVKDQGDAKVMQKGPLVATARRDKKTIHLLSTADDPAAPAVQVERKRRDGTRNNVSCPIVVREYNAHMNGIDHADQLRSEHATYWTSKKWWHYVFWFLVDLAVANAFILFRELPHHQRQTKTGRRKPWGQVEFRQALSKQLIGQVRTSRKRKLLTALDPTTSQHVPVTTSRGRCRKCSKDGKRREVKTGCQACGYSLCIDCFAIHHRR